MMTPEERIQCGLGRLMLALWALEGQVAALTARLAALPPPPADAPDPDPR
jgi:hypothetical protein